MDFLNPDRSCFEGRMDFNQVILPQTGTDLKLIYN